MPRGKKRITAHRPWPKSEKRHSIVSFTNCKSYPCERAKGGREFTICLSFFPNRIERNGPLHASPAAGRRIESGRWDDVRQPKAVVATGGAGRRNPVPIEHAAARVLLAHQWRAATSPDHVGRAPPNEVVCDRAFLVVEHKRLHRVQESWHSMVFVTRRGRRDKGWQ